MPTPPPGAKRTGTLPPGRWLSRSASIVTCSSSQSSCAARAAERGRAGRAAPRVAELGRDLLEPDPVLDRVQHRHAPVVRLRAGLHAHDRRRLAAEGQAAVVRVPDVGDVDRLRGLGVEVPVLPVEERRAWRRPASSSRRARPRRSARRRPARRRGREPGRAEDDGACRARRPAGERRAAGRGPGSSVPGQPTPTTSAIAARPGRRAATASAKASVKAKSASSSTPCIRGCTGWSNGTW